MSCSCFRDIVPEDVYHSFKKNVLCSCVVSLLIPVAAFFRMFLTLVFLLVVLLTPGVPRLSDPACRQSATAPGRSGLSGWAGGLGPFQRDGVAGPAFARRALPRCTGQGPNKRLLRLTRHGAFGVQSGVQDSSRSPALWYLVLRGRTLSGAGRVSGSHSHPSTGHLRLASTLPNLPSSLHFHGVTGPFIHCWARVSF